jgi:hypothetical protein
MHGLRQVPANVRPPVSRSAYHDRTIHDFIQYRRRPLHRAFRTCRNKRRFAREVRERVRTLRFGPPEANAAAGNEPRLLTPLSSAFADLDHQSRRPRVLFERGSLQWLRQCCVLTGECYDGMAVAARDSRHMGCYHVGWCNGYRVWRCRCLLYS